jgi:VWFA-related protein
MSASDFSNLSSNACGTVRLCRNVGQPILAAAGFPAGRSGLTVEGGAGSKAGCRQDCLPHNSSRLASGTGLLTCVLLALSTPLGAQDAPATFKSNTNLVIVNVTARDKSGKLIDNLTKNDFVILEDGKPQIISVFELQKLNSEVLPPAVAPEKTLVRRDNTAPVVQTPIAKPEPPSPERLRDRRLIALFFDLSSMQPPEQIRAQDAAVKFLTSQMTKSDMVSIMTYSNKLSVVENFTDDRDLLIADIRKMRMGDSSENAVAGQTGADASDDSGEFTADETEFNIFNTDAKLAALEDATRKLAIYPEKKALVYLASGVSKTGVENQSQLRSTINAANRANVSFYPIDARGLMALVPGGDASTASAKGTGMFTGATQSKGKDSFIDQQETLVTLAADTGGKALLDSNDLTLGMQRVQQDFDSYYILGYYSTNDLQDGKYRRVKVEPKAGIEAKLDFRNGYYASKTWAKFNSTDKERQLQEALELGDPATDLPVVVEIDYFRTAKDKYFVPISAKIPGSAIALAKKGSNEVTEFDFIGQIMDPKGKVIGGVRDGIQMKVKDETAAKLASKNIEYDTGLTLAPGHYRLRFLARENQTGKMGTFEAAFTIPDLDSLKVAVRMSSVVWSSQREPLVASVGTAGTNKKVLDAHPLVDNGVKLVPSITRVFRKDQNLYVYFEVYEPGRDEAKAPSLSADLTLFHGKTRAFESTPMRLQKLNSKRPDTAAFQFQIPLKSIQPGEYICQVNVIDEQAKKFAFSRAPIVVLQ